ncbi:sialic acid-binding Ig-like lectin 14 [Paramisgurnus dabryanus]|uniref:sialic acid-binding Ig-like lectin 14 n=1 Tax=Paramisgurnus dabryanus TaxID=90735 RepID=UPI0031F4150A
MKGQLLLCLLFQVFCVFVLADVWKVKVEPEMNALVSSCVVLPCSFKYPGKTQPSDRTVAMWHKKDKNNEYIYHEDQPHVEDSFKKRTRLVGRLGELNCSLEIDEVKGHDNGPFCLKVELQTGTHSFVNNCVHLKMIEEAPPPELHFEQSVEEGHPAIFRCSVRHTCPSHQPTLTWNHDGKEMVTYKVIGHGNWEVESVLTFIPTKEDDHKDITCTVKYHGVKTQHETRRPLFVKEQATVNHILIPVFCGLGAAFLTGGLCFLIFKRNNGWKPEYLGNTHIDKSTPPDSARAKNKDLLYINQPDYFNFL